jgi:hypothetical protein
MDSRLYRPAPWVATDRNQFKRRASERSKLWSKVVGSQITSHVPPWPSAEHLLAFVSRTLDVGQHFRQSTQYLFKVCTDKNARKSGFITVLICQTSRSCALHSSSNIVD